MFGKNFTPDSFIYKFLAWPNRDLKNVPKDICQLRIFFLMQCLTSLGFIYLVLLVSSCVASFLLYFFTCQLTGSTSCVYGLNGYSLAGKLFTILALSVGALMVFIGGSIKIQEAICEAKTKKRLIAHGKKSVEKKENAIVLMYTSWKDKVCYPVTFDWEVEVEVKPGSEGYIFVEEFINEPSTSTGFDQEGYSNDPTIGLPARV